MRPCLVQRGATPNKVPTIREIAAACGVNHSTVSRALSGSSLVAGQTKDRVLKQARLMGWKPNPLASAYLSHLRSTRQPNYQATLGLIFDRPIRPGETTLPASIHDQFERTRQRADSFGFKLDVYHLQKEKLNTRQLNRILIARNIPGIILHGFGPPENLSGLEWERYAVVEKKNHISGPQFHRVAVNAHRGFYLMLCKAFSLGYKHVGVVVSKQYDLQIDHGVLFPITYAKDHLRPDQSLQTLVLPAHSPKESGNIKRWLQKTRPEIVIGVDLVWNTIRDMGWKIPGDIAFINVDRRANFPHTAGFNQRIEVQLEKAMDLLISQINTNQRGIPEDPILQLVEGCWEDGPSAPPARERQKVAAVNL